MPLHICYSKKKLLIDQFKNIIDLEDNLNFSGKIKTAKKKLLIDQTSFFS